MGTVEVFFTPKLCNKVIHFPQSPAHQADVTTLLIQFEAMNNIYIHRALRLSSEINNHIIFLRHSHPHA